MRSNPDRTDRRAVAIKDHHQPGPGCRETVGKQHRELLVGALQRHIVWLTGGEADRNDGDDEAVPRQCFPFRHHRGADIPHPRTVHKHVVIRHFLDDGG